jgi:uncharacterized protein (TIGR02271 family)
MIGERGIREGMVVYSSDDERLGKVVSCLDDSFIIEKGIFFPREYTASYSSVRDVRGDEIVLSSRKDELREGSLSTSTKRSEIGEATEAKSLTLSEEELVAEKRAKEAGRVTISKDVITEEKQITVPVMREEVHIQREPASGIDAGAASFEKEEISVPVMEEEVELKKRPVVKEQVRVTKTPHIEHRVASESVRREVADIDEKGTTARTIGELDDEGKLRS